MKYTSTKWFKIKKNKQTKQKLQGELSYLDATPFLSLSQTLP